MTHDHEPPADGGSVRSTARDGPPTAVAPLDGPRPRSPPRPPPAAVAVNRAPYRVVPGPSIRGHPSACHTILRRPSRKSPSAVPS